MQTWLHAGNLASTLDEVNTSRALAEKEARQEIEDLETQLSVMCERSCAVGEYEARQALGRSQAIQDQQRRELDKKDAMLSDMHHQIEILDEDNRRQHECVEVCIREKREAELQVRYSPTISSC